MKIQVEFEEMERLRTAVSHANMRIEEMENHISQLDEAKLKERAVALSYRLFEKYVNTVFKSLGFDPDPMDSSMFSSDLVNQLGKDWWTKTQDIKVTLGATVTENFRQAFLRIGVVPKEKISEPDVYKL